MNKYNMKRPSQRQLDEYMGKISLSSITEKNLQIIDVCFYNKEVLLDKPHDFAEARSVVAKYNLDAYAFIMYHQKYYLNNSHLSKEEALELMDNNTLTKKIEKKELSKENQQMLLNINIIHEKIDDVLYLIKKGILPNPLHKNLLMILFKHERCVEIWKELIHQDYEFDETFEEECIERAAITNNDELLSILLDEQSDYVLKKRFAHYLVKINAHNWNNDGIDSSAIDNEIKRYQSIFLEFFQRMTTEDFYMLTEHLKKKGIQEKLEKLFIYANLNKDLKENKVIEKRKI